jgi:hypothetical protein
MVMVTAPVLSCALCRFASHYSPPKNLGQGRTGPRFLFCIPVGGADCALPMMWAARNSALH